MRLIFLLLLSTCLFAQWGGYTPLSRWGGNSAPAWGGNPIISTPAFADTGSLEIKTGTYTGNGSDDRSIGIGLDLTTTGKNVFVMIKRVTAASSQAAVFRTDKHSSGVSSFLYANSDTVDLIQSFTATGFQVGTSLNVNTKIYYYIAMLGDSTKLNTIIYTGNNNDNRQISTNVAYPGLAIIKRDSTNVACWKSDQFGTDSSFAFVVPTGYSLLSQNRIQSLDSLGVEVGNDSCTNLSGKTYYAVVIHQDYVSSLRYTGNATANHRVLFSEDIAGLDWVSVHSSTANTSGWFWVPYVEGGYNSGYSYNKTSSPQSNYFAVSYHRITLASANNVNENSIKFFGFGVGVSDTILVANINDSGAGSLRQAISDAAWDDSITFSPDLNGETITIGVGNEFTLTRSVRIVGNGFGGTVISGDSTYRIFTVGSLGGIDIILDSLRFTKGYKTGASARGAVCANALGYSIILKNSLIDSCYISALSGNGLGIVQFEQTGVLLADTLYFTVENCIFKNNTVRNEGGSPNYMGNIATLSSATAKRKIEINNCAFISNTTTVASAATYGTAIACPNTGDVYIIRNSTISGNYNEKGCPGIATGNGKFYIYNSTIYNNTAIAGYGGGIQSNVVDLRNTIVAGNALVDFSSGATVTNAQNSIIGNDTGLTITNDLGGNQLDTDPLLDAIQQYGSTWCHPFGNDDPPYNAGTDLSGYGITTDQRGVVRPQNATYDVGAFELE